MKVPEGAKIRKIATFVEETRTEMGRSIRQLGVPPQWPSLKILTPEDMWKTCLT
jgi:hypothetical protein